MFAPLTLFMYRTNGDLALANKSLLGKCTESVFFSAKVHFILYLCKSNLDFKSWLVVILAHFRIPKQFEKCAGCRIHFHSIRIKLWCIFMLFTQSPSLDIACHRHKKCSHS